jgi:hypothetical protein
MNWPDPPPARLENLPLAVDDAAGELGRRCCSHHALRRQQERDSTEILHIDAEKDYIVLPTDV